MAAQEDRNRKRNRKARTADVSSSSSSSAGESTSPPRADPDGDEQERDGGQDDVEKSSPEEASTTNRPQQIVNVQPKTSDPEQAFDEFYLKQATREFANDLDKLRSASDFKESSVPMLIEALRQGRACFSVEERRKIGMAGLRGDGAS